MPPDVWNRMLDLDRISKFFIPTRRRAWQAVTEFISGVKGGLIGDFGCGNGRHSLLALKMDCEVIAIDISLNFVRYVNRKGRWSAKLHTLVASVTHPPFRNSVFDAVIIIAVLHNIPTLKLRLRVLRETWRTLRNRGKVMITVWSAFQPRHIKSLSLGFLKLLLGRLWEPFDAEVLWKAGLKRPVYRFYHLYTSCELRYSMEHSARWVYKVFRMDIKKSLFPQNYASIAIKMSG